MDKKRSDIAKAAAAERRSRERFYVSFSMRQEKCAVAGYRRGIWPMLFKTYNDAREYLLKTNMFQNREYVQGRGRLVSYTVEKVTLRRE